MSKPEGGHALDLIRRFESLSAEMSSLPPNSLTRPPPVAQIKTDMSIQHKSYLKVDANVNAEEIENPDTTRLPVVENLQSELPSSIPYVQPPPLVGSLRKSTFPKASKPGTNYSSSLRRGSTWSNTNTSTLTEPNNMQLKLGNASSYSYDAPKNNAFFDTKVDKTTDRSKSHLNSPSTTPILKPTTVNARKHADEPGLSKTNSSSSITGQGILSILNRRAEIDISTNNTDRSWLELAQNYIYKARHHKKANNLEGAYVEFMMAYNIFSKRLHSPCNSGSITNNPDYIKFCDEIASTVVNELEELQDILGSQTYSKSSQTPKLLSRAQSLVSSNNDSATSLQQLLKDIDSEDEYNKSALPSPTITYLSSRPQNEASKTRVQPFQHIYAPGDDTADKSSIQGIAIVNRNRQSNRNAVVIGEDMGTFEDFDYSTVQNLEALSSSNSATNLSELKQESHAAANSRNIPSSHQQRRIGNPNSPPYEPRLLHPDQNFNKEGHPVARKDDSIAYGYADDLYMHGTKNTLSENKFDQKTIPSYRENYRKRTSGSFSNSRVRRWSPLPENHRDYLSLVPPTHPPPPNAPLPRMPQTQTQAAQYLNTNVEMDMQFSADGPAFYSQPAAVGSDPSLSGRVQSGGNPRNSGLFDHEALLPPETDLNQISAGYNSPVARPHRTSQLSDAGSYGVTGLSNFGNTCFMNSVLQCIIGTGPLKRYFMRGEWKKKLLMQNRERAEVVIEFSQLLELMWRGQYSYISPSRFRLAIGDCSEQFEGDNQEDAHEFASFLLDVLHESLNHVYPIPPPEREMTPDEEMQFEKLTDRKQASIQWKRYIRRSLSIITSIFQGQIQSRLTCMTCNHTSTTYHTFTELSVPIPEPCNSNNSSGANVGKSGMSFLRKNKQKTEQVLPVNIYQCLDAYSEMEVLDGNDKWMCPRCKTKRKATKQLKVSRLPQVLIVHLKRFSTRGHFREKLETNVHIPTQRLYMENYITPGAHPSAMYNLYAVVNHFGTMSGGHYTASVFDELREQWNYFDDTKVFPISETQVASPAAYLLFFVQERAKVK